MLKEVFTGPEGIYFIADIKNSTLSSIQGYQKRLTDLDVLTAVLALEDPDVSVEAQVVGKDTVEWVRGLTDVLTDREKQVITLAFGIGEDDPEPVFLEDIGDVLGVSGMTAGNIERKALRKMRHFASRQRGQAKIKQFRYQEALGAKIKGVQYSILEPQRKRALT
jgi:DNA-directed RNA polymerase specialized sigma subunit